MSTAPKLPIERAREVIATWNADGTWRERNALNLPGEVDDLADALEALIREHEALTAAFREREAWIDPQRLVDLAQGFTDSTGHGWAGLQFSDVADGWDNWTVETPGDNHGAKTPEVALRKAEA